MFTMTDPNYNQSCLVSFLITIRDAILPWHFIIYSYNKHRLIYYKNLGVCLTFIPLPTPFRSSKKVSWPYKEFNSQYVTASFPRGKGHSNKKGKYEKKMRKYENHHFGNKLVETNVHFGLISDKKSKPLNTSNCTIREGKRICS